MLEAKTFELRDRMAFIPLLAVNCRRDAGGLVERTDADEYLLGRAGYGREFDCVIVTRLDGHGSKACFDPFDWGDRTMKTAHELIEQKWSSLQSGEVIDVEFLLGETTVKKISEAGDPAAIPATLPR